MNYLLFIGIVQALFFSLLIITNKRKNYSDFFVLFWFLLVAIHLTYYHFVFQNGAPKNQYFLIAGFFLPLIYGPVNFFYINSLLKPSKTKKLHIVLHLIPYLFLTSLFIIIKLQYQESILIANGQISISREFLPYLKKIGYLLAFQGVLYVGYNYYLIVKYQKKLVERVSNIRSINLQWIKIYIIGSVIVFFIIFSIHSFADDLLKATGFYASQVTMIVLIVQVTYFGFYAVKQTSLFSEKKDYDQFTTKYQKSGLSRKEASRIATLLEQFMKEQKPFLNPDLTIRSLSSDLKISQNHLSQTINEIFHQNFYTYTNSYRVAYVKELINNKEYDKMSLLGIAFEAGFNSKSSFNAVFKKLTRLTPNEYKKSIQE